MIRWLAAWAALVPSLAHALSCTPWGVTDAFIRADAAKETYVLATGTLTFEERLLPEVDWNAQDNTPPLTQIPARLKGQALARRGDAVPFETDVTLRVHCFGPWCAGASSGDVLAFLQRSDEGYSISTDPCGGDLFSAPTSEQLKQVQNCLKGRRCRPSSFD